MRPWGGRWKPFSLKIGAARRCSVLEPRVPEGFIFRWRFGRHAEILVRPGPQIDVLAAFAAERPEPVAGGVHTVPATGGADDDFGGLLRSTHKDSRFTVSRGAQAVPSASRQTHSVRSLGMFNQLHKVSSNVAASLQACSRPSASWRIRRTDTIRRLPLISGIKPIAGSMRRRSNW